jgi:ABC-type branched-subunit amino acid transport system substrate-binding protein
MISVLGAARKALARVTLFLSAMVLVACQPASLGGGPSINTSGTIPVALLVPQGSGNGGDAVLASSLVNAARLAVADLEGVEIDLRVYDTAGQPGQAASVASQAVAEGAKIILGPVYAESANAAGNAVASQGINVLSFSNNTAIAGGNVFVMGPTFQNTADRLAQYAARQGRRNVMIVYGQDAAEELGRDAISRAASRAGLSVAGSSSFELSQQGVINAVPGIASQIKSSGADAVFFTSGTAGALPILTQLLRENGLDSATTQFMGLQRWDIPTSAISLSGLQGGWFAVPDPGLNASFQSRYAAAYGGAPHPIAGLAYDGIAAIGALVKSGNSDALTRGALTQSSGFVGVNGVFRLLPDGTNERGLAVAQIQNNQVNVIDPAPRSFGGIGF